jgi:hypothetical protein
MKKKGLLRVGLSGISKPRFDIVPDRLREVAAGSAARVDPIGAPAPLAVVPDPKPSGS